MNPSFPIQRPGMVNNPTAPLATDPHLLNASHPASNQWAALNTNPDLQRTLCKAAAAGQLNPEQTASFAAYMKGNPSVLKIFQLELQANQQHIQQQQQQQLKQQSQDQDQKQKQEHHDQKDQEHLQPKQQLKQHLDQEKLTSQHAHQNANGNPGFMSHPLAASQSIDHYQQSSGANKQPMHTRPIDHLSLMSNDTQLTAALTQFKQAQDNWNNPNLSAAEREAAGQRARELREVLGIRMAQLGIRRENTASSPSPAPPGANPQNFQPAGQTGQPQHPSEIQRAQLSAVYQRQQQMLSGMPLTSQPSGNVVRPITTNNLSSVPASSPRPNLNHSERNSPAPNGNNTPGLLHSISRPSSSHQSVVGTASSPPAIQSIASPPNNSSADLTKRRAVSRQAQKKPIGTPVSNVGSPINQALNLGLSPRPPPTPLANAHTAQPNQSANSHGSINPSQSSPPALQASVSPAPVHEISDSPPAPPASTATTPVPPPQIPPAVPQASSSTGSQIVRATAASVSGQTSQQQPTQQTAHTASSAVNSSNLPPARESTNPQPASPVPTPFPPPRPTVTGGHAAPATLAGSVIHRPPTNGLSEALGQPSGGHDNTRGQEVTSANRIISKRKIQELVESIDPSERLESEVEDLLLELADEFIDSVTRFSCQLAKHRKSDRLETKDIQLHLERSWNIRIPGFANDEIRQSQSRRINALPSYQARVAAVRDAAKKRRTGN
ncbi:hypothetical protein O181_007781 [Austropuccinia psidii MF-1]|uniref:TBP-associated factor 12 n=1 Tax=Austropuccinia psidii MF-1 TaxID=1389203 RepID=A0A9Q3BNK0_9BASI|nr:hypothetical protein [Austropuccinia psidii MF-1]